MRKGRQAVNKRVRWCLVGVCLVALPAMAAVETFTTTFTYQTSAIDTRLSARTIALHVATSRLVEEFVASPSAAAVLKDTFLPNEQLVALLVGLVRPSIVEETWDGHAFRLKVQMTVEPHEVVQVLERVQQDRHAAAEFIAMWQRATAAQRQIQHLQEIISSLDDELDKLRLQKQYAAEVDTLTATAWFIRGTASSFAAEYHYPLLERAGVKKLNFHALRHTAASLMLARNVPIAEVSAMLGHASPAVTLSIYSHFMESGDNFAATATH